MRIGQLKPLGRT